MSNAKPEKALKRAEELINVGQKEDALQALHNLITSKRYRAWQKPLERIMFKYVELCVDMRKSRFAKDGLIQYRIACQQVNVSSLEEVIKHFMHLSTEKDEQARSQAQALEEALDVDDLEADKRPEDLVLSYVSGEKGKDRSERELVTPWFKFLWETYRTVLEILRNNSKLEALYAMTAHRAFQFCKQYKRTTEFQRLCEIIRLHLANLNKYRDQRDRPELSAPESLQLYLDTRFEQLKIATELGLWQEAFCSVEDIHGLMSIVKKTPKASLMVVYYAKLTEIFWISGSYLYHAYAWFKLFILQKSFNKNLSQKDLQLIASSVVLAALSVSPYDQTRGASHLELENEKERDLRMANVIGFNLEPKLENREVFSRSSFITELVSKGVLIYTASIDENIKTRWKLASDSSVPEVQLSQYVPALEKLATLRLLKQVSQVYQTMKFESLSQMIPFFYFSMVEKISVDAVKHNFIAMKVDHMKGVVQFGNMEKLTKQTLIERAMTEQLKERHEQEKRLQKLEVELSRQRHDGDLKEKNSLARMLENKMVFQERVMSRRQAEFHQRRVEREERIKQIIQARKQERDIKREKIFYVRSDEERIKKLHEEEEARKREEAKRTRIGREREAEARSSLGKVNRGLSRPSEIPAGTRATEPGVAAPSPGKYVPRFQRERPESSGPASPSEPDRWVKPAPSEPDRWTAGKRAPPPQSDRWTSGSRAPPQDSDRLVNGGSRALPPDSDSLGGAGGSIRPEPWRPSRSRNPQRG
ncbi:hypothetical protein CRYUN_Cryun05aG0007600 [Craigia yunnanensis]